MASPASSSLTAEVESVLGPPPSSYAQTELVVLRFRRYGGGLMIPVLLLTAIAVLAGYWVGGLPDAWMNVLLGVGAAVAAVAVGILPILAWMTHRTTVTTRRIIVRRGLFARTRGEVSLNRVRDVRLRRSPLQRLAGTGTVEVLHGSESLVLTRVPGAPQIAEALHDLMERNFERASRSRRPAAPGLPPRAGGSPSFGPAVSGDDDPISFW